MIDHEILIYALLGGILPAVLWLNFWLKEDRHQEPRKLILGSFLLGGASVFVALPIEHLFNEILPHYSLLALFAWASTEEAVKLLAAYFVALRTRFNDEPIDAMIYLLSSALGFSAIENTLFLLKPFSNGDFATGLATINLRFIGASLLHIICSVIIAIGIGFAFYKKPLTKKIVLGVSFLVSALLHTAFNNFIIKSEYSIFFIFSGVWIGLIAVIVILEKIKKIKKIYS